MIRSVRNVTSLVLACIYMVVNVKFFVAESISPYISLHHMVSKHPLKEKPSWGIDLVRISYMNPTDGILGTKSDNSPLDDPNSRKMVVIEHLVNLNEWILET